MKVQQTLIRSFHDGCSVGVLVLDEVAFLALVVVAAVVVVFFVVTALLVLGVVPAISSVKGIESDKRRVRGLCGQSTENRDGEKAGLCQGAEPFIETKDPTRPRGHVQDASRFVYRLSSSRARAQAINDI